MTAPPLERKLGICARCGDHVILRPGIKRGQAVHLTYDADGEHQHKLTCGAGREYPQYKTCRCCHQSKPVAQFRLHGREGDGLRTLCRLCEKIQKFERDTRREHEEVTA